MPLNDPQCRKAKITGTEYQIPDGGGLSLVIRAKGTKTWLYQFRLADGTKSKLRLGGYPEVSLADARLLHAVARQAIELGRNPCELMDSPDAKRVILDGDGLKGLEALLAAKEEASTLAARMTFGQAAERYKTEWVNAKWKVPDKGWSPVRTNLLPKLGDLALEDIDAPMLRDWLLDVRERRGTQAALIAHGWAERIFTYAIEHTWCIANPAQAIKAARIGTRLKRKRWMTAQEIRRYLAGLYQSECYRGYKLALHLLLMLALRKNELCGANWGEFDLGSGVWTIPPGRMKGKKQHMVFLPVQAVDMLRELQRLGGGSPWVLPMPTNPDRPMNGNNLDGAHHAAITAAKINDYVIHDHRHTASTHLREMGNLPEVVETALSHAISGMAGTYSHAQYREQRLTMLQAWADFLDKTMNEQVVIQATFRKVA